MKNKHTRTILAFIALLAIGLFALQTPAVVAQGVAGTTLTASKTANAHWTLTYHWTIDKSVTPDTLNLFTGDSGVAHYTIAVTKDNGTTAAWIDGQICVTNGGAVATQDLQIVDNVTMPPSQTVIASVNVDVSSKPVLAAGESACYNYHVDIPSGNIVGGATYKDTADIAITNHSGHLGTQFGPNPSATSLLPTSATVTNDTINVDDTNGSSWPFSASGTVNYDRTFTCNSDEGQQNNTATIRETGQSDSASVNVKCYALKVTKDAATAFKRTYNWKIDKSVTPATWDLFRGDSGTSAYSIAVTKDGHTDSDWTVNGHITVQNPAPMVATLNSVADVVAPAIAGAVDCGVTFPYALAAGGTLACTYSANLPDGADRINTATATLQNTPSGTTGFSGTAAVKFGDPTTEVNTTIHVDDSNGSSWSFSDSGTVTYNKTFTCDADAGKHDNTATIRETGQSASASVTVNCHALEVTKDATPSLKRTYHWTIDKSADQSSLTLAINQAFLVNYSVSVGLDKTNYPPNGYVDTDFAASGNITVHNPAPVNATLNSLADVITGVGAASVSCNVTFPYTLVAGGTLNCTYSASLPDTAQRTNTATATLQNYNYASDGAATAGGSTDFSGTASIDFATATINQVDRCINVTDTYAGTLGTVCAGDAPKTFTYSRSIGAYTTCGDRTVDNTATFTTNDTQATGSASVTINIHVPCQGCTLTIGYWKTHAGGVGMNADKVTPLLPQSLGTSGGTKSIQVNTAALAVQLLSFKGSNNVFDAANGINKLYAQLLAAKLNLANGADGSIVTATITAADAFLASNNSLSWSSLSKTQKNQVLGWLTILDNYNNGLVGPGHCSEEVLSAFHVGGAGSPNIYLPLITADNP